MIHFLWLINRRWSTCRTGRFKARHGRQITGAERSRLTFGDFQPSYLSSARLFFFKNITCASCVPKLPKYFQDLKRTTRYINNLHAHKPASSLCSASLVQFFTDWNNIWVGVTINTLPASVGSHQKGYLKDAWPFEWIHISVIVFYACCPALSWLLFYCILHRVLSNWDTIYETNAQSDLFIKFSPTNPGLLIVIFPSSELDMGMTLCIIKILCILGKVKFLILFNCAFMPL